MGDELEDWEAYRDREFQYRVRYIPTTMTDGTMKKVGTGGGDGSDCQGEKDRCTYDWLLGNDRPECPQHSGSGALDRLAVPSPLAISLTSSYDAAARGGRLTAHAVLEGSLGVPAGTFNAVTILLFERGVMHGQVLCAQVVRRQALFAVFEATQPGQEAEFSADYSLDPAWAAENVGAVAFVQNYRGRPEDPRPDLFAQGICNSGFLQNVAAASPPTGHSRPVTHP